MLVSIVMPVAKRKIVESGVKHHNSLTCCQDCSGEGDKLVK